MAKNSLILVLLAALGVASSAQTPGRAAAAAPDIIGLRLGMTEQEAVAALRAYSPSLRIRTLVQTLPNPQATRATATMYAGVYGDDRAGIGDEVVKLEFSNPTPTPRVLGIWRKQSFPRGHELAISNTLAAIQDKYGAPQFQHTAPGVTLRTWATGLAVRPAPGPFPCGGAYSPVDALVMNLVASDFIEPRVYFNAPDCGVAINAVLKDTKGLVSTIGTSLVDYPAGVRAREEIEVMGRRPDTRVIEAEQRGKPKL
jgi:hypothetical protein